MLDRFSGFDDHVRARESTLSVVFLTSTKMVCENVVFGWQDRNQWYQ